MSKNYLRAGLIGFVLVCCVGCSPLESPKLVTIPSSAKIDDFIPSEAAVVHGTWAGQWQSEKEGATFDITIKDEVLQGVATAKGSALNVVYFELPKIEADETHLNCTVGKRSMPDSGGEVGEVVAELLMRAAKDKMFPFKDEGHRMLLILDPETKTARMYEKIKWGDEWVLFDNYVLRKK